MKEYIVEYFQKGSSVPLSTRQGARSPEEARTAAKREKGNDIIIGTTREA